MRQAGRPGLRSRDARSRHVDNRTAAGLMAGPERPDQPDGPPPPFGKDDDSVLDARLLQRELESTRRALQSVQITLTQMRYKPGPDKQVPEVREITRVDGQWPFLLVRSYPGDVGKRPVQSGDEPLATPAAITVRTSSSPNRAPGT